jgi:hypothetical protein
MLWREARREEPCEFGNSPRIRLFAERRSPKKYLAKESKFISFVKMPPVGSIVSPNSSDEFNDFSVTFISSR